MDWQPSPEGLRDNIWAGVILAVFAFVGAAVLAEWTSLREMVSTPILIVLVIGIYGLIAFAINQTRVLFRREKTPSGATHSGVEVDLVKEMKVAGIKFPPKLPFPDGYDRLIPARWRAGLEEEIRQSSRVWFAAIAGLHLSQLTPGAREKIDRVLLVEPDSEYMKVLRGIQAHRGRDFPVDVGRAIEFCKGEEIRKLTGKEVKKIEVRLSNDPVLNVTLFDPGTEHAWARVQEFIPYALGQQSLVYVIRKEDWKEQYETIEASFEQTWKNGHAPGEIS